MTEPRAPKPSDEDPDGAEFASERPSKSARKRMAEAAQKLGEELAQLKPQLLDELALGASLRDAIAKYQGFKSREARRRQRQFIGSLMRNEDLDAIKARLQNLTEHDASAKLTHHALESWRERLIGDTGNSALTAYLSEHPDCEAQPLRQLVRKARSAVDEQQRRTSSRALYRFLARHNKD